METFSSTPVLLIMGGLVAAMALFLIWRRPNDSALVAWSKRIGEAAIGPAFVHIVERLLGRPVPDGALRAAINRNLGNPASAERTRSMLNDYATSATTPPTSPTG